MDFIAKKYTVLMSNEPLTLWIKNNEVQSAKFMDKKVSLNLDTEAIKLIKDNPTKIVNGNNLLHNQNFTQSVSRMMSSKLELAIATNDKKTLSRYARSDLVPEDMKHNFISAINRQNGLRGVLKRAIINTNAIFQDLAKKIDRFFDKLNDRVINKKLDPYLKEYQLSYVNRAPPVSEKEKEGHLDPKLMQFAEEFYKNNGFNNINSGFKNLDEQIKLNQFLHKALEKGFSLRDSNIAIHKVKDQEFINGFSAFYRDFQNETIENFESTIANLKKKLQVHELKEASKNETIEDFKTLSKNLSQSDRIDILIKNKEYLQMPEEEKRKIEDTHIFNHEPILKRAEELGAIFHAAQAEPIMETVIDRTPSIDFLNKTVLSKINDEWQQQQTKNRASAEPTRDFMNISAVRFNGVSKESLDRWAETAKTNSRVDSTTIDKFVDASLRNAKELLKIGVLKEVSADNFKFVDNFAKQSLYQNISKTTSEIAQANQGREVTREAYPQDELKERLESITSPESFQKIVMANGKIDPIALQQYTDKIVSLSAALHTQEKANVITREDLRRDDLAWQQSRNKSQEQHQAGGIER